MTVMLGWCLAHAALLHKDHQGQGSRPAIMRQCTTMLSLILYSSESELQQPTSTAAASSMACVCHMMVHTPGLLAHLVVIS